MTTNDKKADEKTADQTLVNVAEESAKEAAIQTPVASQPTVVKTTPVLSIIALLLVLVVFGLMAWFWMQTNQRFMAVEQGVNTKLSAYQGDNQESMVIAKQADERSAKMQAKTLVLEEKMAQSESQQKILQTLFDQLSANREAVTIAEVEQLITIANQQLRVTGNVNSALLALEAADEPLASINTQAATTLRLALGNDIAALRSAPQVNVLEIVAQLENLALLCEDLPLSSDRAALESNTVNPTQSIVGTDMPQIRSFAEKVWEGIKNFVTIERIDAPAAPLLSVDHRFYLRENLKLRLMTARIALLQRDKVSYLADLNAVKSWLNQYYDAQHPNAEKALEMIAALSEKEVGSIAPTLAESLEAVHQYKTLLESQ